MKEMDLDRAKQSSICETVESEHVMSTSEIVEVEMFCDVVSEVLDRMRMETHPVARKHLASTQCADLQRVG